MHIQMQWNSKELSRVSHRWRRTAFCFFAGGHKIRYIEFAKGSYSDYIWVSLKLEHVA